MEGAEKGKTGKERDSKENCYPLHRFLNRQIQYERKRKIIKFSYRNI